MRSTHKLVLLRHGQSTYNFQERFTGWSDPGLTTQGKVEARAAGRLLRQDGYTFDVAFTSLLKRAIKTLWISLQEMDLMWIPVHKTWRLNERHYGALEARSLSEVVAEHGEEQVKLWRFSYDIAPPLFDPEDPDSFQFDRRYSSLSPEDLPGSESLKEVTRRMLPYWQKVIAPKIKSGQKVLIVSHANTLRALIKYLEGISDQDIVEVRIPTGSPLVYEVDADLRPISSRYLIE
jgi:2,3-bisphosphoglycerate-dependent phosphoglycerate mutase